jgi:rhodanese-related sulfurtransferase
MKKIFPLGILLLMIFVSLSCRSATQKAIEEFGIISTPELVKGIEEKTIFIFDNNSPKLYREKHIPTAVFLDYHAPDPALLPPDKNAPLVFYCKNVRCTASHQGARYARSQGYQNLRIYPLGIDGWVEAGLPVESGGI